MADRSYTYRYDHLNQLTAVYDSTDTTRKAAFTYDALGRRIEHINDVLGRTTDYYFDGASELAEYRGSGDGDRMRYTVHGVAYIDEHLMMMVDVAGTSNDRPYYYVQDRLYNVWAMIDRAGAVVERYAYDAYGLPLIRESAGRGDMNNDTLIDADPDTDKTRFLDARDGVIWDSRADMDDDGDVDDDDVSLFGDAELTWPEYEPTVAQAFSDVGNPFMFQGVPHFALDTADDAETAVLPLNHHRARFADPVTGRWLSRDASGYRDSSNLFELLASNSLSHLDPDGRTIVSWVVDAFGLQLHCAAAIEILTSLPINSMYNAPFSHCLSHCLISRYCGSRKFVVKRTLRVGGIPLEVPWPVSVSELTGIVTEHVEERLCKALKEGYRRLGLNAPKWVQDLCNSSWQQTDFYDNQLGDELATRRGSCWQLCQDANGGTLWPPDGPPLRPWGDLGRPPWPRGDPFDKRPPWPPTPEPAAPEARSDNSSTSAPNCLGP